MIDNPVLEKMESGQLSPENWTIWACQRYHAAHRFIPLLEAGKQWAEQRSMDHLTWALQDNLDDENGINNPQLGSHEKWRQDFYTALGVTQEQLNDSVLLPWTIEYRETLQYLEQWDLHELIGALLYLEFSIPHEFRRIQKGRDLTFPEEFVIQRGDWKQKRKKKWLARLYIDHHITHDADSHFPDLMKSIEPLLQNDGEWQMIEWIRIIARAKTQFYACLERELIGWQLHNQTLPEEVNFHRLAARYGKGKIQENAEFQSVHRCYISREKVWSCLQELGVYDTQNTPRFLHEYQHFDLIYMAPGSTITPHKHQTEAFALPLQWAWEIILESNEEMISQASILSQMVIFESWKIHALKAGKEWLLFLAWSVTPIVEWDKVIDFLKEDEWEK